MSRTYKKYIRQGICTGSNTEYYRDMNRKCRQKNNHELRNLMANNDIEEVNDKIMNYVPIHNDWDEPTDGTILIDNGTKKNYTSIDKLWNSDETLIHYWNRKFGKYLKPKNRKHYRTI